LLAYGLLLEDFHSNKAMIIGLNLLNAKMIAITINIWFRFIFHQ